MEAPLPKFWNQNDPNTWPLNMHKLLIFKDGQNSQTRIYQIKIMPYLGIQRWYLLELSQISPLDKRTWLLTSVFKFCWRQQKGRRASGSRRKEISNRTLRFFCSGNDKTTIDWIRVIYKSFYKTFFTIFVNFKKIYFVYFLKHFVYFLGKVLCILKKYFLYFFETFCVFFLNIFCIFTKGFVYFYERFCVF